MGKCLKIVCLETTTPQTLFSLRSQWATSPCLTAGFRNKLPNRTNRREEPEANRRHVLCFFSLNQAFPLISALLLDLLFWQPQKNKNTTLVPSYWICFFGSPKKKKNLCPRIGFVFSKATKKKKHSPYAKHKHNPCALVLDLLFWRPKKNENSLYDQVLAWRSSSTWRNVSLTWIIPTNQLTGNMFCFFWKAVKSKYQDHDLLRTG